MGLISKLMGVILYGIYQVVHNYGLSMILFTILIKLVTLPSTYKMQVNQARQGLIAPQISKIKKAFPNNPQRQQEEQNKLFTKEGINPSAGCLSSFLTIFLLFPVFFVVLRPLTYILRLPEEQITQAKGLLTQWLVNQNLYESVEKAEKFVSGRPELLLLQHAKEHPAIFDSMPGFVDQLRGFDNSFLGFDLAGVPSLHPENGWTFTNLMLVLLPFLAALVYLIQTIIMQSHSKKVNPDAAKQMGAANAVMYLSPLMTIWIGLKAPAGLSFYWLVNAVLTLIVQLLLYKYLSGERLEKINAKEKEKQLAKGPGWMQRMMEQSAAMQAQQNGTAGNHTQYEDGDDGMTRKERAEYEKKLIEAARKRAALKYGEEAPKDLSSDDDL
ncbi:MAG: YidC/Oxa1 family membrane protein insertase [Oscillospiraceae bacterium]|nr:YidC/Oxa1 family membrane protein insertase [Oscillospiraceae bacterium]MBR5722042.1 YidC/Oxa1 family membrane protein insertase [Oscillospiraceae bacterium]